MLVSYLKSNYHKLTSFAYIPIATLQFTSVTLQNDELFNYLCFAFERAQESVNYFIAETYVLFNTGLKREDQSEVFAYFEPNRNTQRQVWCMKGLYVKSQLEHYNIEQFPVANCDLSIFNLHILSFAFAPKEKYEKISSYFTDNIKTAQQYISNVFTHAYQLGYLYIDISRGKAVFDTGLQDQNTKKSIYAIFSKNQSERENRQEWYLNGFFTEPKGFTYLPDSVIVNDSVSPDHTGQQDPSMVHGQGTLLVTALPLEYDALLDVLKDEGLDYIERTESKIGNREFRYIYIKKLNTYVILSGQSFECMIPIIQSILAFKPIQAILSGIAFSFDMSKAPYNSIVVSKSVFDYESAKINEDDTKHRGNKLPAGINLRQLYTDKLKKGVVIKSGDYASGMKVVNSLKYQEQLKNFMPELLAGDEEGFFFAHVCSEFKLDWIVVKAISDYGTGKTDDIQKTAAYAALSYAVTGLIQQQSGR